MVRPRQLAAAPPHGTMVSPHNAESAASALPTRGAPKAEAGLDRAHVDALADPHELARTGEARQGLVDRRAIAEVKQGGRTQRRGLRDGFGMLHAATGKAAHVRISESICQKSNAKTNVL